MVTSSHLLRTQILAIKNPLSISGIIILLFLIFPSNSFSARVEVTGGGGGSGSVSDTVYGAGWDGDTTVAPSKNAVYDKIETIASGGDNITVNTTAATNANLLDNLYIDWAIDTAATPDDITSKFNYAETLAGNPALLTTECIFMADGLMCEGTTADTIEMKLAFPDPATTDKTITLPNATDTLIGKDTTDTLTNKTMTAAANVIDADTAVALAADPADCGANTFATTIAASGALTCATPALGTDTSGNYVLDVADGTGIDGTASAEGATYTPTFDATELEALTWGAGGNASNIWTFNLSGTDPTITFNSGEVEVNPLLTVDVDSLGNLTSPPTTQAYNGLWLVNDTTVASATRQSAPYIVLSGHGWTGSADQITEHALFSDSNTNGNPTFYIQKREGGSGAWSTILSIDESGQFATAFKFAYYDAREVLRQAAQWSNDAAATVTYDQYSPYHRMYGQGWKTNATAGNQAMSWGAVVAPEQGAVNPIGVYKTFYGTNNSTPTETNEMVRYEWGDRAGVVFNELAFDRDFRVESDTITNALSVDGGTGAVTMGGTLDVTGAFTASNISGTNTGDNTVATTGDSATSFFASGTLEVAIGGTGTTTSTGTGAVVLGTSPTFTTSITATNLIVDAHLATTESINLPVYSAKLTGAFVVFTPPTADACTQGAQIDAGEGPWRLLFDATTDECVLYQLTLPDYWAAHSELKILYSMSSATANEVEFEAAVMCVTPTDAADVGTAGFANVATASDTVPGTAGYLDSVSITITDDSCAASDIMFIVVSKDADDAVLDDATGDTEILGIVYEFTR